jgi:hypothetical protein
LRNASAETKPFQPAANQLVNDGTNTLTYDTYENITVRGTTHRASTTPVWSAAPPEQLLLY